MRVQSWVWVPQVISAVCQRRCSPRDVTREPTPVAVISISYWECRRLAHAIDAPTHAKLFLEVLGSNQTEGSYFFFIMFFSFYANLPLCYYRRILIQHAISWINFSHHFSSVFFSVATFSLINRCLDPIIVPIIVWINNSACSVLIFIMPLDHPFWISQFSLVWRDIFRCGLWLK